MTDTAVPSTVPQPFAGRRARVEAEMGRDLLPLTGEERRESLDLVTDEDGAFGHYHGIFFVVDECGAPLAVGLDDVEDFIDHYGLPATHAHAAQVWKRVQDEPAALAEIEEAIIEYLEDCAEDAADDDEDFGYLWSGRGCDL